MTCRDLRVLNTSFSEVGRETCSAILAAMEGETWPRPGAVYSRGLKPAD